MTLPAPPTDMIGALESACESVKSRAIDRLAAAHDASHYLLTPHAVATPRDVTEIVALLDVARTHGSALTFRSGGTSLSGQAGGSEVVVDTRRNFRSIHVLDEGHRVRTGPGATVRQVNMRLARHQRKLGPDPASEIACTIGGVIANNSSGMACGISSNTYQTIESMVFVLPSGTIIDSGNADADEILRAKEPALYAGLERLRDRIARDQSAVNELRRLYAIKNTMGYGLNSFLDFARPIDILVHLIVGSEGTLAFVAEATFRTVPVRAFAATGLFVFRDLAAATAALPVLAETGCATIELMDATSLRVIQQDPEATDELCRLQVANHAGLLVEYQEGSEQVREQRAHQAEQLLATATIAPAQMTTDSRTRARLWHLRKGLFTAVAGNRPPGTTALLEDIAVPMHRLNQTCAELTRLFDTYGYQESVIFGHARDGNIHFMINERFDQSDSLVRYNAFTEDMVSLVLSQGGTLKAEHGTGRIMAPFVRRQFGEPLYQVMQELKQLIDPEGLLNPGVLLSDDNQAHLSHLKTSPTVESEVDRCVECGYCEPVCPSKDLTLTPRERIVIRREIARANENGDTRLRQQLEREYQYDGVETCAVDGMCQSACPVLINTGDLIRRLRAENQNALLAAGWTAAASSWQAVSRFGGAALTLAHGMPSSIPRAGSAAARALLGKDTVPQYSAELPRGGQPRPRLSVDRPAAVYFSSCTTTMFGPEQGGGVTAALLSLCARADIPLSTPPDLPSLCCGTPWKSKGYTQGYAQMREKVVTSLMRATRQGELPIVCDASSCVEGLQVLCETAEQHGLRVIDAVQFVDERVLPALPEVNKIESVVTLHPTCSSVRLGINESLMNVARVVAEVVRVPDDWTCCGFAGDRGMLHPELTRSATQRQAAEVTEHDATAYASVNRTCELGMTRATGRPYRHILELLAAAVAATQ